MPKSGSGRLVRHKSGPQIDKHRFKNGARWCQNGVQDGLLGIRAVKGGILDHDATTTPIHEAVLGGLLGSCWGSCWAHVGMFFVMFV